MITSVDNERVKAVVRLRRSRERRRGGLLIAEGPREVERAQAAGLRIVETYFAPSLIAWPDGTEVSERVLAKMAYRAEPEGVIALVETPARVLPVGGTLYVVCVGVEKPGNLGAMARSAEAAGADALIVVDGVADPWNPNAIRASTGAVFSLPVVEATREEVLELGVSIVSAVVGAPVRYTDADLRGPVALVVGAEDTGLPDEWREPPATGVSIPMVEGLTDSLNTATAAAVLLFEAVRQRA